MKNKLHNTYVTKGQLKFIIATDIFIFATIAMILFEMKKDSIRISYLMLGLIFIAMGYNQYIYYKNNDKNKKFLTMMIIYGFIGLVVLGYGVLKIING